MVQWLTHHISSAGAGVRSLVGELRSYIPCGTDGKASAYNSGDLGSISGSGRSPGEGNGNTLQYSSLEYPMDRGVGQLDSWVPTELDTT